ncbi:MAG: hypothetical protein ACI88H_000966 [Cocleimonas sp.]|jgi:hypothetical protein
MITESTLTCPHCDYKQTETLLENISPINFRCDSCLKLVRINTGECCIYCNYGDYPCIQTQIIGSACCNGE